jgi:S-formylglutathione hydrolase
MLIEKRSESICFDGVQSFWSHPSTSTGSRMNFGVYLPPQARQRSVPAIYCLAGLTCTEETFMIKAGAQRYAAQHGIALVTCDTSPRGLNIEGDSESWDFGVGAGFYVDATASPWAGAYRMRSYVSEELPALIEANFPVSAARRGICGHSMGGHGALTIALRDPARWHSLTAFAPIANPVAVPWGAKAFARYLGDDRTVWERYDASLLMRARAYPDEILVDQGDADQFLERELHPHKLEEAARISGQHLTVRRHIGYDHSYWFIQTYIADHVAHHARRLLA